MGIVKKRAKKELANRLEQSSPAEENKETSIIENQNGLKLNTIFTSLSPHFFRISSASAKECFFVYLYFLFIYYFLVADCIVCLEVL